MAETVEEQQNKLSNTCCAVLKKKYSNLAQKYSKVEELKNKFRDATTLVQQQYDLIEKENESLKAELRDVKVQAERLKAERDNESGIRVDLEDEVSALKDEIKSLKQNHNSASQDVDAQLQERLLVAEKEINKLKELLEKESCKVATEKKNYEMVKKKADEDLKNVETGKRKNIEEINQLKTVITEERGRAELEKRNAEMERKKAAEALKKGELEKKKACKEIERLKELINQELAKTGLEKKNNAENLKGAETGKDKWVEEINMLKELLEKERGRADFEKRNAETERKKAEDALKKVEMEKSKASEAQTTANLERRRAEENKISLEKLKTEFDAMKSMLALELSKLKSAEKEVKAEKRNTIRERKRADLAMAKAEEHRKLAEMNIKKAVFEEERAGGLIRMLEEEKNKVEKLKEFSERLSSGKLVEAQSDASATHRNASTGMLKNDSILDQGIEKILLEKEQTIAREKKRAATEIKNLKKQKKVAEAEKNRADQLSRELDGYKMRLEELQKELQELVSYRMFAESALLSQNSILNESDTVKVLQKQLNLERMLVQHAQQATEIETVRNTMLHQEIFRLKQACTQFRKHLDILDDSCLHYGAGTQDLEKMDNQTFLSNNICSNLYPRQLISGIDSGLYPQHRGSNQKLLKSSAINSSSASFSDRPLVGSQERGTYSVMTSAKPGEDRSDINPTKPILSDQTKLKYSENGLSKAEKCIKRATKYSANDGRAGKCDERRIVDAVESIEGLYSKGHKLQQQVSEKLSLLHGILKGQIKFLEPREENVGHNSCREHVRPFKRRKMSSEGTIIVHPSQDPIETENTIDLDINDSCACAHASPPVSNELNFNSRLSNELDGIKRSTSRDFEEMILDDYMSLLNLDNAADERSYRRALATPLSPTLPDVQFHGVDADVADQLDILVEKSSHEGPSDGKENLLPSSNFAAPEMLKNGSNLEFSCLASLPLHAKKDSVDFRVMNVLQKSDDHFPLINVSDGELGVSDLSGTQNEGMGVLCDSRLDSRHNNLKFLVIFSENSDRHCISRILQAANTCMPKCSLLQSAEVFLQSIMVSFENALDLSMKEKACVFLSLIHHGISEVGTETSKDALDENLVLAFTSSALQIQSAFSVLASRRAIMESCDLFELLALAEDFLLQRRVWVCGNASAESDLCGPKIDLIFNDHTVLLTEVAASTHQLVAVASVLASLCSALDHLTYLFNMSYNVFRMQNFDPVLVLAILHSFAYVCGSMYCTIPQYTGKMTIVKSLVMFLEKLSLSSNSTSFSSLLSGTLCRSWSCTNCPFSEGAVSMEDVASLILETLQKYVRSVSWPQDVLDVVNLLAPKACSPEERTMDVFGLSKGALVGGVSNESLCDFVDNLSLVEILASFMSWEWIFEHFIGQLCELLESCLMEGFSAALITLLGQLGRIGVDAGGYEDTGVRKIRQQLSVIMCEITFRKLSLPSQFAGITALCGLTCIKFGDILEGKEDEGAAARHSIPAPFIRKWFFLLSDEQQSFVRGHLGANENNCMIEPVV